MTQARTHIFDSTLGTPSERSWLDNKVLRRELTEDLSRQGLSSRAERATQAASSFRDSLSRRAQLRNGMQQKGESLRRQQEVLLKRKADEYRERLRRYLRPEERRD